MYYKNQKQRILLVVIITIFSFVLAHSQPICQSQSKVKPKKEKTQKRMENPNDKSIKICQKPCKVDQKLDLDLLKMNINKI